MMNAVKAIAACLLFRDTRGLRAGWGRGLGIRGSGAGTAARSRSSTLRRVQMDS